MAAVTLVAFPRRGTTAVCDGLLPLSKMPPTAGATLFDNGQTVSLLLA